MAFGRYRKVRTIRIGCDEGEAEMGSSFFLAITKPETPSYSIMCWELSKAFFHAQVMKNENLSGEPFKVSVLVDLPWLKKHKPSDPETGVDRIEWFIKNMLPSDTPMIFTIYGGMRENYLVPHQKWWMWPMQYQWDPRNVGDYVTVQAPEMYNSYDGNHQRRNWRPQLEYFLENCPWEVKMIGYNDPIDYCYQTLKHTRYHFSYHGATYYIATMMKVPCMIMGYEHIFANARDWDNDEKIVRYDLLSWDLDRVVQLRDISKKRIGVGHINNHRVIQNLEHQVELMKEFDGFTD